MKKIIPKYSLTEGLNDKVYRKIIEKLVQDLPDISSGMMKKLLKNSGFLSGKKQLKIFTLHHREKILSLNILKELRLMKYFLTSLYSQIIDLKLKSDQKT